MRYSCFTRPRFRRRAENAVAVSARSAFSNRPTALPPSAAKRRRTLRDIRAENPKERPDDVPASHKSPRANGPVQAPRGPNPSKLSSVCRVKGNSARAACRRVNPCAIRSRVAASTGQARARTQTFQPHDTPPCSPRKRTATPPIGGTFFAQPSAAAGLPSIPNTRSSSAGALCPRKSASGGSIRLPLPCGPGASAEESSAPLVCSTIFPRHSLPPSRASSPATVPIAVAPLLWAALNPLPKTGTVMRTRNLRPECPSTQCRTAH